MTRLELLNAICNRPEMLEALAPGFDSVDMSAFFDRPGNVFLGDADGAAIFAEKPNEPGVFEGHYLLVPGRPGNADLARSFLRTMFTEHGASAIWGFTPKENAGARALSRLLGFAPRGTSLLPSGRSCVIYVLERTRWETSSGDCSAVSAAS